MSLNIKNERTWRLAGELAQLTGETMTGAITVALEERLERERRQRGVDARLQRMRTIASRCAKLLREGGPPVDHGDLLYDDRGLAEVIVGTTSVMTVLGALPQGDSGRFEQPYVGSQLRGSRHRPRGRSGAAAGHELDAFLEEAGIELEPVTLEQAQSARRAWRRFGKGNHPAGLNFGDCFAYALAEATEGAAAVQGPRLCAYRHRARMIALPGPSVPTASGKVWTDATTHI